MYISNAYIMCISFIIRTSHSLIAMMPSNRYQHTCHGRCYCMPLAYAIGLLLKGGDTACITPQRK